MTTTTNAAHLPTNFVPGDYTYVDSFDQSADTYNGPSASIEEALKTMALRSALQASAGSAFGERISQCDHCGAHIRYVAVLRHEPTGDLVGFGHDCVFNRVGDLSQIEFRLQFLRTHAQNVRLHEERLAKRDRFVAAHPACALLVDYSGDNAFLASLARQLLQNGELSARQVECVERNAQQAAQRAERAAQPEQVLTPAPSGKQTITGEVVSTKIVDNAFNRYGTLKMLVLDDRQFKVWVTVPLSLNVERGDRVTFTCTLEVSDRDACFAFGKRPTKASVLS